MSILRKLEGCNSLLENVVIREDLGVTSIIDVMATYRRKFRQDVQRMPIDRLQKQRYKISLQGEEKLEDLGRDGEIAFEVGTAKAPNLW